MKKSFLMILCMSFLAVGLWGCGNDTSTDDMGTTAGTEESSEDATEGDDHSTGSSGENSDTSNGTDKGDGDLSDAGNDLVDGAENAVDDVTDGVSDMVDGTTDAASDVVNGVFESFDDASDWFLDQIPNSSGRYSVENSDKDLTSYSGDRTGYHIELHDSNRTGDTKVGDFYVDSENGKVYKSDEHGETFAEYDFSDLN
jgi:hypothetical protein